METALARALRWVNAALASAGAGCNCAAMVRRFRSLMPPAPASPPASSDAGPTQRRIDTWIFDLDNTLYPSSVELFAEVDRRMGQYIADLLAIEYDEARRVQKEYFRAYGTTLRGLMIHHRLDPLDFLDHVHRVDIERLDPDPALATALSQIEGRKIIFTNASRRHAESVLDRIGVRHEFDAIHDIVDANFVPKPDPDAYRTLVERFAIDPHTAAMFEDVPRNLEPAAALGMITVLIRSHHEWAKMGSEGAHIHFVADNLADWLGELAAAEDALP